MPKKKRRTRKPAGRSPRPSGGTPIPRLVDEFRDARHHAGQDPDDAWIIEPLAELKRDLLASPDPTVWTAEDLSTLLLQIVPRKVHLDAEDRQLLVPTVSDFLAYLAASGRWSPRSSPLPEVVDLLDDLAELVPAALADPARRSMGGNILELALAQGVDPTDESDMAVFIDRFNALDDDARHAVTETGRLPETLTPGPAPGRGAAFGLGQGGRPGLAVVPSLEDDDDGDDFDLTDVWPDFLGEPVDGNAPLAPLSAEESAAALSDTVLVRRADQLLDWLGTGRKLTGTFALRRADTAQVLDLLGIDAGTPRSMWDVPALAMLWNALTAAGFLELRSGTAHPAGRIISWAGADAPAERRLEAGNALIVCALSNYLGVQDDGETLAHLPPLTFLALLKATQPGGVHVPEPQGPAPNLEALLVRLDLLTLVDAGILTREADAFFLPANVLSMLPLVMKEATEGLFD